MIKVFWHGHSFVEIQTDRGSILIDPFMIPESSFDIANLENIKTVVLTHGHGDHLGSIVEIATRSGCQVIGIVELMAYIKTQKKVGNTIGMNIGGEIHLDGVDIKLVNAIHSGSIESAGNGYYTNPCGVIVRVEGNNIYHAGDTALTYDMKLLGDYDKIDLAFLPIGDYYTMGIKDAIIATSFIKPKIVVPIHFDSFDVIKTDPQAFAKEVMLNNYATPKILDIGQYVLLK